MPISNRRQFLKTCSVTTVALALPTAAQANMRKLDQPVSIGLIADLHQDVMHDAPQRLAKFLTTMQTQQPDAIAQLGDFAVPAPKNQPLIDTFNNAHPHAIHVLGNHDTDGGYTTEQTMAAWGMRKRYYSTNIAGLRIIVLDGNEPPENHESGYPSHIGKGQAEWLRNELQSDKRPTVILSHQPLAGPWCIDNAQEIQQTLNNASDQVLLALNGHTHIDDLVRQGDVGYLHVNSASYVWVGSAFKHQSYSPVIHANHPKIAGACPYQEALFTTLTFDPINNQVLIEGCKTEWVGPSPAQRGRDKHPQLTDGEEIVPRIRSRTIPRRT